MNKFAYFPKFVKVLYIHYNKNNECFSESVKGFKWIIGKYFIAENSYIAGLIKGDKYIIKEFYHDI